MGTGRRSQPGWRETEASMAMEGVTPAQGDVLAGDNRSQVGGGRDPRRSSRRRDEERRGRQSGGLGLALGILNNPADADGNYNFNFADNGMEREESGHPGAVEGGYSYTSPEGELVSVEYVADEFGFHPVGSHIPVAPPMPPHVRRLLDHLAKVNGLAKL